MENELICPIDNVTVNEHQIRLIALLVFITSVVYLLTTQWYLPALLAADFLLRATYQSKFSPFRILSTVVLKQLKLPFKPANRAPKIFAARIGLLFSSLVLLLHFLLFPGAQIVAGVLILFSFLESALSFCAGCYVYTYLVRWRIIKVS